MTVDKFKKIIMESFSVILFSYEGIDCGIDPMGMKEYDVWCGDNIKKVGSLDDVFNVPIFKGKKLLEIIDTINDFDR